MLKLNSYKKNFLWYAISCVVLLLAIIIQQNLVSGKAEYQQQEQERLQQFISQKTAVLNKAVYLLSQNDPSGIETQLQIKELGAKEKVYVQVCRHDSVISWNNNMLDLVNVIDKIESGISADKFSNGWYLVYRYNKNELSYFSYYLLRQEYAITNNYLQNRFNPDLTISESCIFSKDSVSGFYPILNPSGKVAFYISLNDTNTDSPVYLNLLALVCSSFFFYRLFKLSKDLILSYPILAFILELVNLVVFRWMNLHAHFPGFIYRYSLFSSKVYASSWWLSSMGDLLLNSIVFLFICHRISEYLQSRTEYFVEKPVPRFKQYQLISLTLLLGGTVAYGVLSTTRSLLLDSSISFDVNRIYETGAYYFVGALIIGFLVYGHILLTTRSIELIRIVPLPVAHKVVLIGLTIVLLCGYEIVLRQSNEQYLTLLVLIYVFLIIAAPVASKNLVWYQKALVTITVISLFSANYIFYWNNQKEKEKRKVYAFKLTNRKDVDAEYYFKTAEDKISADPLIRDYFKNSIILKSQIERLVKQNYFTSYLGSYDIQLFDYDSLGNPYKEINSLACHEIDSLYRFQSITTLDHNFRFIKSSSDLQGYLGRFTYGINNQLWGVLYILLQPKIIKEENRFDELLVEGRNSFALGTEYYSYALYKERRLINQTGDFPYPSILPELNEKSETEFFDDEGYSHMLYSSGKELKILISKKQDKFSELFAIFSMLFVVYTTLALLLFLIFTGISLLLTYLEQHVSTNRPIQRLHGFLNSFFPSGLFKMRLISTRIQVSIILLVFPTLLLTFYFTIDSMIEKYKKSQFDRLGIKARSVVKAVENDPRIRISNLNMSDLALYTHQIGDFNNTDINLYDLNGKLIATTSRIYDAGIIAPLMNKNAFYELKTLGRSQVHIREEIGQMSFLAAYQPILDSRKNKVAYLNLPYFVKESELYADVTSLFISIINIYVIAFLCVIIIVYILSRNITSPLLLIRDKMAHTSLGRTNEMIEWKGNDEIAELVAQYNKMIEELVLSAERLSRSEREHAWREMAKQVAHEIKNPLTPMKLSVQHLQRAWNDKSPNLEETFKRVTGVLIEQIDSMSLLATEFSSFAKLPSSQFIRLNAIETLHSVILLYLGDNSIDIEQYIPDKKVMVLLDKDQLMRVFNNLIKNAIQSIPESRKGKITIRAEVRNNELNVSIGDNGTGIDEEQQTKIFLPNFSTKNSGMGLGLAIVKNIIESAGGRIKFETKAGEGTIFYVILPVQSNE